MLCAITNVHPIIILINNEMNYTMIMLCDVVYTFNNIVVSSFCGKINTQKIVRDRWC